MNLDDIRENSLRTRDVFQSLDIFVHLNVSASNPGILVIYLINSILS